MIGLNLDPVNNWLGYDLKSGVVVSMKEAGIIDPAKVTRTALENAASVAGTVLLTECVVVTIQRIRKNLIQWVEWEACSNGYPTSRKKHSNR